MKILTAGKIFQVVFAPLRQGFWQVSPVTGSEGCCPFRRLIGVITVV